MTACLYLLGVAALGCVEDRHAVDKTAPRIDTNYLHQGLTRRAAAHWEEPGREHAMSEEST